MTAHLTAVRSACFICHEHVLTWRRQTGCCQAFYLMTRNKTNAPTSRKLNLNLPEYLCWGASSYLCHTSRWQAKYDCKSTESEACVVVRREEVLLEIVWKGERGVPVNPWGLGGARCRCFGAPVFARDRFERVSKSTMSAVSWETRVCRSV